MTISKKENQRRERVVKEDRVFFKNYWKSKRFNVKELDPQDKTKSAKTPKTPDFFVTKGCTKMYCELKSMFDEEEFNKENQFRKRLIDKLQTFRFPFDFRVGIDVNKIGVLNSKMEKQTLDDLKKQVKDLTPYDQLPLRMQDSNKLVEVVITRQNNSQHLELEPGPDLAFGRGKIIKTTIRVGDYVKDAQSKFKNFRDENASYVLVIFIHTTLLSESQISGQINHSLQSNKNTTISAISLYKSSRGYFSVLHNPFTKYPLNLNAFRDGNNKQVILNEINNGWKEKTIV